MSTPGISTNDMIAKGLEDAAATIDKLQKENAKLLAKIVSLKKDCARMRKEIADIALAENGG